MAEKKGSGVGSWGYPDPYNEVANKDPNKPDVMGDGLYYDGYDEVMKMHLAQTGPMVSTPNSESGGDTMGGTAPGEPNPAKMAQHK